MSTFEIKSRCLNFEVSALVSGVIRSRSLIRFMATIRFTIGFVQINLKLKLLNLKCSFHISIFKCQITQLQLLFILHEKIIQSSQFAILASKFGVVVIKNLNFFFKFLILGNFCICESLCLVQQFLVLQLQFEFTILCVVYYLLHDLHLLFVTLVEIIQMVAKLLIFKNKALNNLLQLSNSHSMLNDCCFVLLSTHKQIVLIL